MRYLELGLYVLAKFVVLFSIVFLFGIVAVEIAICPEKDRFVESEQSGAVYVCDRDGDIARLNAALRSRRTRK